MAANPGRACRPKAAAEEATRNGSPSIKPTAWDTAFNTRLGAPPPPVTSDNSAVPQTAVLPGRVLLAFLTRRSGEHSTSIQTVLSSSVARLTLAARFTAFVRAMRRTQTSHRLLIR